MENLEISGIRKVPASDDVAERAITRNAQLDTIEKLVGGSFAVGEMVKYFSGSKLSSLREWTIKKYEVSEDNDQIIATISKSGHEDRQVELEDLKIMNRKSS